MIRSGICTSAKLEFLQGKHQPDHDYRVALFVNGATLSKNTTQFTSDFEAEGPGYISKPLEGVKFGTDKDTAFMTFDNVVWPNATITARGCMIFNDSLPGKPSIAIINFGRDVKSDKGDFTLAVPAATATTAVIRIS